MLQENSKYTKLTFSHSLNLAAPHTWPASIMPVCIAIAAAYNKYGVCDVLTSCILLVISVLMQSAVNTINDYYDFIKGTDTASDNVEESDSVLIHNNINPKHVLALAVSFLITAFLLGIYIITKVGFIPLLIAIIGAICILLYSGGKLPISYLPIGEFISGFIMGGLISLASYHALTGNFDLMVLVWAIPVIIGIGLIMLTNNTCDIEKDIEANRKTYSVCVGRNKAKLTYKGLMIVWVVSIVVICLTWFGNGAPLVIPAFAATYSAFMPLWNNPLLPNTRIAAMKQICTLNIILGAFYTAILVM